MRRLLSHMVLAGALIATVVASSVGSARTARAHNDVPTPHVLADIEQTGAGSNPSNFTVLGSSVYFVAFDEAHGEELWSYSLQSKTAALVADIHPGIEGSSPRELIVHDGKIYFTASDEQHGRELWVSDGTAAGTSIVAEVQPGPLLGVRGQLVSFAGEVYFQGDDGVSGAELWRTHPLDGVRRAADIAPGVPGGRPSGFVVVPAKPTLDVLYFQATDGTNGRELYRYDPTYGLVHVPITVGGSTFPAMLTVVDEVLYLTSAGSLGALVRVQGADPVFLTADTLPLAGPVQSLASSAGKAWVITTTAVGNSLYVVDDANADPTSIAQGFVMASVSAAKDGVLFVGTSDHGSELWFSGGTSATTGELIDIVPGAGSSHPWGFTEVSESGVVLFAAQTGAADYEIWRTDGTSVGTHRLTTSSREGAAHSPVPFFVGKNTWMLSLDDGTIGREPWLSDGTVAKTRLAADINTANLGSSPGDFAALGGDVLFPASDREHGKELRRYNPQTGSITLLDVLPGQDSSRPAHLVSIGDKIVYAAQNDAVGNEPWVTDGTVGGTTMLVDILPGSAGSHPDRFVAAGSKAFFRVNNGLWATDGSSAGTLDLSVDVSGRPVTAIDDRAFFSGQTGVAGSEPWVSDGTPAGTKLLGDVRPGSNGSNPQDFTEFDGAIYFVAADGLWRTHGVAGDAVQVSTPSVDRVLGVAATPTMLVIRVKPLLVNDPYLYMSSNVGQGFIPVTFDGIGLDTFDIELSYSEALGDRLVATLNHPWSNYDGDVLVILEGTTGSVIRLGTDTPAVIDMVVHEDHLYFTTNSNDSEIQRVWVSSGTEADTEIVHESSEVSELALIGDRIYYGAHDLAIDDEPFWIDVGPDGGFLPLPPARLLESRPGEVTVDHVQEGVGRRAAGSVTEVEVAGRGGVPADAVAVSLNVTIVGPDGAGFATVFPCGGAVPTASNINYTAGDVVPNAVLSQIGTDGKVCVYTLAGTHLIVDVNGAFEAGAGFGSLVPARLLESRPGEVTVDHVQEGVGRRAAGSVTEVEVAGRGGVPADAVAVSLNVTIVGPDGAGFATVFPCGGAVPTASNINYVAGDVVPNAVLSQIGSDGKVCVFTLAGTHLIVDVNGAFEAGAGFGSLVPARLLESRPGEVTVDGVQEGVGRRAAGSVTEVEVAGRGGVPADAVAVSLNVTIVGPDGAGFATVFPCGGDVPTASNINYVAGDVVPNAVLSQIGTDGKVCVYTLAETHLIVDVNGAFS